MKAPHAVTLDNLRIALTREAYDNAAWAAELWARGAAPVEWPCIRTQVLTESATALRQLVPTVEWLAVCSSRALSSLRELAPELQLAQHKLACVGPATAEAAREFGAQQVLVSREGTAHSLAHDLLHAASVGERVLLLRAEAGRPEFAEVFAHAGRPLLELALYRTTSNAPQQNAMFAPVDAVFFASPSAVRGFAEACTPNELRALDTQLNISIGPSTSAALATLEMPVAGEATTRDLDGMLRALEQALRALRPHQETQ